MAARIAGSLRYLVPEPIKRALRLVIAKAKLLVARRATTSLPISAANRRHYKATQKLVVFVSAVPRVREAKFAHGLRKKGWTVVLLYGSNANYDLARQFDVVIPYADPDEAVRQALKFSPVAYHVFAPSGDLASTTFIRARPGPVVFDTTDLLEITYFGNPAKIELARYAIELQAFGIRHADGYCARDLQFKLSERKLGYRLGGRVMYFPEFCWGTARDQDGPPVAGIRCVQAGNFGIEKQGEGDWGYLLIAEKFARAGIGFDLYPNWTHFDRGEREFKQIFSDYFDLASREPLFKFHRPVRADELSDILREYDVGISLILAPLIGEHPHSLNPEFLPYCMSARVFDYLDAGLPVILNASYRLINAMLRRYGAGVAVDGRFMDDIGTTLRALPIAELKRNAVRASHGLAVERHIHRLERFYAQVAADVGISVG